MGRARKYQLSVGLSSDLIDLIEKAVEDGGYSSRSQFVEEIIRENIHDRCITCEINRTLTKNGIDTRYVDMPKTLDDAQKFVEDYKHKAGKSRHAERTVLDIVDRLSANGEGYAQLVDVLNEAERLDLSRDKTEEVIDKLNQNGRLMRPTGYDTLQIV